MKVDQLEDDDYVPVSNHVYFLYLFILTVSQVHWARAASFGEQKGCRESCRVAEVQGQHITANAQDCEAPGWLFAVEAPIQGGSARQRVSGE